ncbi:RagB/SusD family nutrient uptake outer membrane protein [uncultured Dysgonomonas sp.]|uniref:SusD family protein n=1 Tax=uncultured Dysgonomonas sp. TaxID=206096 RepID=A0A212ITU9_9BACT|nr:RagB/SusD family nutrient uptake outer membrane protein [uncultured Dysgonomonas sp.]SBV90613.1 SusD family protein [uncultured Dysgonomonas sp.]
MKRITIISIICLALASCDLLDIDQNTKVTTGTAWSTENSAKANVTGMYYRMRSAFSQGFIYWGEYRNGLWGPGRVIGSHEPFTTCYTSTLNASNDMANWADIYTTINQANLVITHLPDVTFASQSEKNEALAGAYYVRAFCYYWIARIWGDAPLELIPYESIESNQYSSRSSVADVFAQVEADISSARGLMPITATSKTTASYASVEMLTADYYLWKYKLRDGSANDLEVAATAVANVLGASGYDLESNFASVFTSDSNSEVIFKWPYIKDEYEGGYPYDYLYNSTNIPVEYHENPVPIYTSRQQWVNITVEYAEYLYSVPTDTRAATSYGYLETINKGWVNKFPGHMIESARVLDSDINAYRFADAIFFDAEIKLAQNDISGARNTLNRIAKRAYGVDNYYARLSSADDVKNAIVAERKKEFVGEGRLWWDFIRLGVIFDECSWLQGRENAKNILLWPVHNSSLNSNPNIKQTDGY